MKNFKALSQKQMNSIKGGNEVMGRGSDSTGIYNIVDDGFSCTKVYIVKWGSIPYFKYNTNL